MEKRKEGKAAAAYLRSAPLGLVGVLLFFALLLAATALSETQNKVMELKTPLAKAFLFAGAFASGMLAGNRAEEGRLLHALSAELPLLLVLAFCALAFAGETRFASVAVDLTLLLFGAFAGTALSGKRRVQRRGKK